MITDEKYIVSSLELNLFFARIMKEHAIFLEAGFTSKNLDYIKTADNFKIAFESILLSAVKLSNGIISNEAINSNELVTKYTLGTEEKTEKFTGININKEITQLESRLYGSLNPNISPQLKNSVKRLNNEVINLVTELIDFKTNILNHQLSCNMFTLNYPLLIEHILREAKLYKSHLESLENGNAIDDNLLATELFWDQIMMEHAQFIRGLLDPSEDDLIKTADNFANEYKQLLMEAKLTNNNAMPKLTYDTVEETLKFKNFKDVGTKGISECKIRSIILPLLADHVLRESNHYLKLLNKRIY